MRRRRSLKLLGCYDKQEVSPVCFVCFMAETDAEHIHQKLGFIAWQKQL